MRTQSADTDLQAEKIQLGLLQRATLERRVGITASLSEAVVKLAAGAIRRRNPDLDDRELLLRFVEIHYGSKLAEGLRRDLVQRSK
jgi:hypothetical protein